MRTTRFTTLSQPRTVRVPCAEHARGGQLKLDDGLDPKRGGWQLLFRGYGEDIRFNALPLTFLSDGVLVAQVIAVRAEGLDWWGCFVPEPAPRTPEEADARFGVEAGVGAAMRQLAQARAATEPKTATPGLGFARPNRHARRARAAQARRSTGAQERRPG